MSNSFLNPPRISRKSLRNTIFTDQQVFRWFMYITSADKVRDELRDKDDIQKEYQTVNRLRPVQRGLLAGIMGVVLIVILTQNYLWIWLLLPLWAGLILVERPLKAALYRISQQLIDLHYDDKTFVQHTLYQIGEFLAKHYEKNSLVDGIALTDTMMRKWIMFVAFLVVFMFVMSFWRGAAMIFLLYFAGNIVINSGLIYRRYLK